MEMEMNVCIALMAPLAHYLSVLRSKFHLSVFSYISFYFSYIGFGPRFFCWQKWRCIIARNIECYFCEVEVSITGIGK